MNTRLYMTETLMSEGGLVPLDVACGFMAEGYDMNRIEDRYAGRDVEFEITPELYIVTGKQSLILAQIERWRHALHMQVERQRGCLHLAASGERVSTTSERALEWGITSRKIS